MKYLLFDENAILTYVNRMRLQSIEYEEGERFINHLRGKLSSEYLYDTRIEYATDGILFVGKKRNDNGGIGQGEHIFCIDLLACKLFDEETCDARVMTVVQKAFRLAIKIWHRRPFSPSERINETKSILFPFFGDKHRLVIERSNSIERLEKRNIIFPLLAYKYNSEEPGQMIEQVEKGILRAAGETYYQRAITIRSDLTEFLQHSGDVDISNSLVVIEGDLQNGKEAFVNLSYKRQFDLLTLSQKRIVEHNNDTTPIRIEGAAGTGKTVSMIMRAYRLLCKKRDEGQDYHVVFFAHNESTSRRNQSFFERYECSDYFLNEKSKQSIVFTTLLTFCCNFASIPSSSLTDSNASAAKESQALLIDEVVNNAIQENRIRTIIPLLSDEIRNLFDRKQTSQNVLVSMLQHEFSVQIKGRTDCTFDSYCELKSIPNGIPCSVKRDKELVYSLFNDYQESLQSFGSFDIDDVTIEAISRLNAPFWRRNRKTEGFDYIFVDEMHLFNFNEQSIFHFLSKEPTKKDIPLCFALDYSQAIGDRGDVSQDYMSSGKIGIPEKQCLNTLFRSSPEIVDFCASIAASGTLMFGKSFNNPYYSTQNQAYKDEVSDESIPKLLMYPNDDRMINNLGDQLSILKKQLNCKQEDIAVITFDSRWISSEGINMLERVCNRKFQLLSDGQEIQQKRYIIASPYDINGLEFGAVVLLGVDEGRVPQTTGTSDVSKHYIMYASYNMLYLASSRAKSRLLLMGSELNGVSSCLEHTIDDKKIIMEKHE